METILIPSLTPCWSLHVWSYTPKSQPPYPVIVMANGLGCNKLLGLAAYAEEFSAAGYACLVFDYRRWGASDGTRRNSVYVSEQQDDYRTVIKFARQQPQYDPQRVIIWGFSFSGGHVLTLASEVRFSPCTPMLPSSCFPSPHSTLRPVWLSTRSAGRSFFPFQYTRRNIIMFVLGALDFIADFLHLPPVYIRTVAPPGEIGAVAAPNAVAGFSSVAKTPSDFPNQIAASTFFRAPLHSKPRQALHLIQCPLLLIAGMGDRVCLAQPIIETSHMVPTAELFQIPGDHFDFFKGNADWEKALGAQLAFLRKHFPVE
ncbi:alpha/beta-hydrolase [Roridomyces roridus]|uniref:Alpha/beta-hydrolase n=1 Tax=Roridomyces roridus TaxID=1738132 RepID=A0AAD7FQI1_9AGAR|nr:alpha/beta-hydrolase [Roridomyces roridus]